MAHFLAILLLVMKMVIGHPNYAVTHLESNPGIYYENLHPLRFTKTHWKIATFIDLDQMHHPGKLIANQFHTLNSTCPDPIVYCDNHFRNLKYLLDKSQKAEDLYDQLLADTAEFTPQREREVTYPSSIVKRSVPFSFVGSLSKSLFGTLSEDDGLYYDVQIDKLLQEEKQLAHLVQKQAHLSHNKFGEIHKKLVELKSGQRQLFDFTLKMGKKMKELNTHSFIVYYSQNLTDWKNTAEASLEQYIEAYRTIADIIKEARQGRLHPGLLNKTQIQQIQQHVHDINAGYEFPVPKDQIRAERLSEVSTVRLGRVGNRFLIEVQIPLLDSLGYELYQMHPLPIPQNFSNDSLSSTYIIPRTSYLAVATDKVKHTFLSREHVKSCKKTVYHYICNYEGPLHEDNSCEIILLLRPMEQAISTCDVRYTPKHVDFWKRISNVDGWLFSVAKNSTVQVYCPGERAESFSIGGIGIVQFKPRCYGRHKTMTLNGIHTVGGALNFFYLPKLSFKILDLAPQFINAHKSKELLPLLKENAPAAHDWSTINDADSLLDLEKRAREIAERVQAQKQTNKLVTFQLGFQTATVILFVILIIAMVCRYLMTKKQLQKELEEIYLHVTKTPQTSEAT